MAHRHLTDLELSYLRRHIKYNLKYGTVQKFCESHGLNYTNISRIFNGKSCELHTIITLLKCAEIIAPDAKIKYPRDDFDTIRELNKDSRIFTHEFFTVHEIELRKSMSHKMQEVLGDNLTEDERKLIEGMKATGYVTIVNPTHRTKFRITVHTDNTYAGGKLFRIEQLELAAQEVLKFPRITHKK